MEDNHLLPTRISGTHHSVRSRKGFDGRVARAQRYCPPPQESESRELEQIEYLEVEYPEVGF